MTAAMRAAMGRALRHFVVEDVPVFLRGPRPSPAAQPAEKEATLTQARHPFREKVLVFLRGPRPDPAAVAAAEAELAKRGNYYNRAIHLKKKTAESTSGDAWFFGFLLAFAFLQGHEMGKRKVQKTAEAMDEHK